MPPVRGPTAQKGNFPIMADFNPVHYRIQLSVDIDAFRFSGRTVVRVVPRRPSGEITLNACDLNIRKVTLLQPNGRTPCPFQVDPAQERLTIFLPECASEEIQVQIDHEGSINNRMAGLYRSSFRQDGKTRWLAVTQFQESDARRVFPCMDHPARKATFAVELTVPANLTAVSNTPPGETVEGPDGRKTVRFETTPKMSTYLLFMGIGPFETRQDTVDRRLFALTTPGMTPYSDFALAFAREALGDCESYFAIPYPLAKLDLIAVPDFAFGAMENWGAITFRENLLLRYPDTTSRAGLERICEVTAHEIVHQWFGNLVTPADWRYLWLNESFATYFAYSVVDRFRPDWRIWERFIGGQTAEALERDGFDVTYLATLPNMVVMSPKDENELRRMLLTALHHQGPIALRYPRGSGTGVALEQPLEPIEIGTAEVLCEGRTTDDILIIAIGSSVEEAVRAGRTLKKMHAVSAAVINARFVKPLDIELLARYAARIPNILTVEENTREGGFGSAVLEALTDSGISGFKLQRLGIRDVFVEHGPQQLLRRIHGVDEKAIVDAALHLLQ